MNKRLFSAIVLTAVLGSLWAEGTERPAYANISFTVWRLDQGEKDIPSLISMPMEKAMAESWIFLPFSMKLAETQSQERIFNKGIFRFSMNVDPEAKLHVRVDEKGKTIFTFQYHRPSSARHVIYDSDSRPYLILLSYSLNAHVVGPISPGILK